MSTRCPPISNTNTGAVSARATQKRRVMSRNSGLSPCAVETTTGFQGHAADGALAGPHLAHLGMHRAGVFDVGCAGWSGFHVCHTGMHSVMGVGRVFMGRVALMCVRVCRPLGGRGGFEVWHVFLLGYTHRRFKLPACTLPGPHHRVNGALHVGRRQRLLRACRPAQACARRVVIRFGQLHTIDAVFAPRDTAAANGRVEQ